MEMQFIQNFLSTPNLPDIIAYAIGAIILIYQIFAKLGIKKDNFFTASKISKEVENLKELKDEVNKEKLELARDREALAEERKKWEEEKLGLQNEMVEIKKSVRLMSKYSKDLVKTGVSRKINRMLPVESEAEDVTVLNKNNQEDKKND